MSNITHTNFVVLNALPVRGCLEDLWRRMCWKEMEVRSVYFLNWPRFPSLFYIMCALMGIPDERSCFLLALGVFAAASCCTPSLICFPVLYTFLRRVCGAVAYVIVGVRYNICSAYLILWPHCAPVMLVSSVVSHSTLFRPVFSLGNNFLL